MAIASPGYAPGGFQYNGTYNFVSSMDVHKPEIDSELTKRYGSQYISELLMYVGSEKPVYASEYSHFEEDRIQPKIKATSAGAGAGALATFTLDAAATGSASQASPYVGSVTEDYAVPRVGDILLIKPASGTVNASSYIRARVEAVNVGAGTFTAYPTKTGDSVPAIGAAAEIIIIGNAFGEGSNQPASRISKVTKYTNNTHIFKETYETTGTEDGNIVWFDYTDPQTGKSGKTFGVKGEADAYARHMINKENILLLSEKITNVTLANAAATAGTPIATTEGLIPFMLSQGNVSSYSAVTGVDLNEIERIIRVLDKQKGAKNNMFACGINLSLQLDNTLADRVTNGGVTYGNFNISQDAAINLQFSNFKVGNYMLHKKTFDCFNDLQTLGADGYGFANEGMIIPMDNKVDAKTRESIQSIRLRYKANPEDGSRRRRAEFIDNFKSTQDGADKFAVRYLEECGLECFAGNRFVYVQQA